MANSIVMNVRMCKTSDMQVDKEYQRHISKPLVKRIVESFEDHCFDFPLVGVRQDGSMWVVDGQTRQAACVELNIEEMPCRMFESRGRAHEAEIFRRVNETRRSMKRYDIYKAALAAGDPQTVEIDEAVRKHGFKVQYTRGWPNISAVAKLYDAHRDGVLNEVLTAVSRAWHGNQDALLDTSIGGLWQFFKRAGEAVDMNRAIDKWKRRSPSVFIQTADQAKASGGSRYLAFALGLLAEYNKGLRSNRLEW